ncbi:ferredoxin-type protein NapF [Canicola haemoglobinophilus]|uniref:Ferredoxin n=1 Tax=Canicola haemoglobinophilus TaxID=733 RepID=A0A1V4B269_9PAST|nr:ferredoxin-type protein NapF [Canicola haemoglobinophilus]OOS01296.1 ferredoxin-type protein NapF [Canicola haemoglobinophilus]STO60144.1 ferredoxin [Canicola haemoglobinophilus]
MAKQYSNKNERYYKAYLSHNTISRRGLFLSLFRSVKPETLVHRCEARPPFSVKESLFLDICNGCGACVAICPYGLIQLKENKPVLDIDFSSCDFCGKCAENCPTHALHKAFSADTELRPSFNQQCVMRKGQHCSVCQDKCPQNAISFEYYSPIILDTCNGCGECKVSCFIGAINLYIKRVTSRNT